MNPQESQFDNAIKDGIFTLISYIAIVYRNKVGKLVYFD